MSDRFPALEDIYEGQSSAKPTGTASSFVQESVDTRDFLSRERALLGNDADQFSTLQDNLSLVQNGKDDGNSDLLVSSEDYTINASNDEVDQFRSSYPSVESNNQITQHMTSSLPVTGGLSPSLSAQSVPPFRYAPHTNQDLQEPAVIQAWRERQSKAIQQREDLAAARQQDTIKAAQDAIDSFYESYNNKKEKNMAQTRKEAEEFMGSREDTAVGGTSWERIAKLIDLNGPNLGKGLAQDAASERRRFRDLLRSLMKDEHAPGARGY